MKLNFISRSGEPIVPTIEGIWDSYRVIRNALTSANGIAVNLLLCDELLKAGKSSLKVKVKVLQVLSLVDFQTSLKSLFKKFYSSGGTLSKKNCIKTWYKTWYKRRFSALIA